LKFQREEMSDSLIEELSPLLSKHWEEVAHYKDIPLSPDLGAYSAMQCLNILRIFTARMDDGKLVGYSFFFVKNHPHYVNSIQAFQDMIYLEKELRGKGFGAALITFCEEELKKDHVDVVYCHVNSNYDFSSMLERHGYKKVDIVYGKRVQWP
jgi:GNAT superfamily N-acetyltransferase